MRVTHRHNRGYQFVRTLGLILWISLILMLVPVTQAQPLAVAPDTPPDNLKRLPLMDLPKMPIPKHLTLDQLAAMYPAFHHAPFSTGFCAVVLPFRFTSPDHSGDPAEANALSFLLSNSLDWSAGNYCARHAYFVFTRDDVFQNQSQDFYQAPIIQGLTERWNATCCVGGVLTHSAKGYSGVLEIYTPDGTQSMKKVFDERPSFFTLLGDMTVATMRHFGDNPSQELSDYLRMQRCRNPQSLVNLGKAAFLGREESAFALFDQILNDDPGFADVRYWAANQRYWVNMDSAALSKQTEIAMESYIFPSGLLDPLQGGDDLRGKRREWINRAVKLTDGKSTQLVRLQFETNSPPGSQVTISPSEFESRLKLAAANPNDYFFLLDMGDAASGLYRTHTEDEDFDLAASIYICALQNKFMVNIGSKLSAEHGLGNVFFCSGHPELAVIFMSRSEKLTDSYLESLYYAGYATSACKVFEKARKDQDVEGLVVIYAYKAAAMAGNQKLMNELMTTYPEHLDAFRTIHTQYKNYFDGKPIDLQELSKTYAFGQQPELCCNLEIFQGIADHEDWIRVSLSRDPTDRLNRYLFDQYQRIHPTPDGADFYEMTAWLFPDDPITHPHPELKAQRCDPEKVRIKLADFDATRLPLPHVQKHEVQKHPRVIPEPGFEVKSEELSPWTVVSAIHQLLLGGRKAEALDMALRYHSSKAGRSGLTYAFSTHLIRLIEESK